MNNWFEEYASSILDRVREKRPLVHHITNYVTVNDCANIVLAIGASPVMADDIDEVREIVLISSALVINIGTLNRRTIESMLVAGKTANEKGIPVILDPVGAGASTLRTETAERLIHEIKFAVIRGNISEIKAVGGSAGNTRGVDADVGDVINENSIENVNKIAVMLAQKTGSVITVTGAIDVISDGTRSCYIENGHPMMANVTGTGCMCTSLIGAFCGTIADYTGAAAAAVMTMGLAGEKAYKRVVREELGSGSYRMFMIDEISCMTGDALMDGGKISFAEDV
jgi:hydroxyethylthiazole kinase